MLSVTGGTGVGISQAMHIPDKEHSMSKGVKGQRQEIAQYGHKFNGARAYS